MYAKYFIRDSEIENEKKRVCSTGNKRETVKEMMRNGRRKFHTSVNVVCLYV